MIVLYGAPGQHLACLGALHAHARHFSFRHKRERCIRVFRRGKRFSGELYRELHQLRQVRCESEAPMEPLSLIWPPSPVISLVGPSDQLGRMRAARIRPAAHWKPPAAGPCMSPLRSVSQRGEREQHLEGLLTLVQVS